MIRAGVLGLLLLGAPAMAQSIIIETLDDPFPIAPADDQGEIVLTDPETGEEIIETETTFETLTLGDVVTETRAAVETAPGAHLRGLDKVSGEITDFNVKNGETVELGWLHIILDACRYPVENPSGDAYAWLNVRERDGETPIFAGWMIASSPALNALDHTRFDVWVLSCATE